MNSSKCQFIIKHFFTPFLTILNSSFPVFIFLDLFLTLYFSASATIDVSKNTIIDNEPVTTINSSNDNTSLNTKRRNKNNLNIQLPTTTSVIKRPFNSALIYHHPLDNANNFLLSSPTSSISSTSSSRSKVEELIYQFETGQHRRYSLDSSLSYLNKKQYIKERKYEYQPLVFEWKKRIQSPTSPFQLKASRSTPIRRRAVNIPHPIPEKSQSTWA